MSGEVFGYYIGFLLAVVLLWLMIGSLNYLFARRRYSYRQAITRPWVLGAGLAVFVLALLGQIATRI